jgi:hypothetical protein
VRKSFLTHDIRKGEEIRSSVPRGLTLLVSSC